MFNVCPNCGAYNEKKRIDTNGANHAGYALAICPHCDHAHPFRRWPLFVLTGASAVGKSTATLDLPRALPEIVPLEGDIFWRAEFNTPHDEYVTFRNVCLRAAKNIGQAGRPVLLSGSAVPAQYVACPEYRYFSVMHTLALICEDDVLADRLRARPAWRGSAKQVDEMLAFNNWFRANADSHDPPITLLDTTHITVAATVAGIAAWMRERLP